MYNSIHTRLQDRRNVAERNQINVCLRGGELGGKEHKGTFWGDGSILYLHKAVGFTGVYTFLQSHGI